MPRYDIRRAPRAGFRYGRPSEAYRIIDQRRGEWETVALCNDLADAERIAAALNATEKED